MSDQGPDSRLPPHPQERRADRFAIGHDAFQFKFDFWQSTQDESERAVTRVLTNVDVARALCHTLRESLRDHDNTTPAGVRRTEDR